MPTIIEKELKILEIDPDELQARLAVFGATKSFEGMVHDVYYDTPGKELVDEKKRIRIRKKGDKYILTMKEGIPTRGVKAAHETEIEVDAYEDADELLRGFGLIPTWEKRKHRITYTLGTTTFDIDLYGHIPPLLEIEAHDKRTITTWITKLGLQKKTTATFGAYGLFRYYNLNPTKLSGAKQ